METLFSVLIVASIIQISYFVCAQEIDKDVEIITGKEMPKQHHQRFAFGRSYYLGDYYGPQVSLANVTSAYKCYLDCTLDCIN